MLTAVFGFGTVFWYVAEVGSAWYIGHVCAVLFSAAAVTLALDRRWPMLIGLFLGLAAISRLPVALASPGVLLLLLGIGWPIRIPADRLRALRTTVAFGLGMAVPVGLYFAYNLARWGTLMDQGYTLIPGVLEDPIYVEHGIFSIEYIPRHIYAIFLQSWRYVDDPPFLQPDWRGLGLFLTTPLFVWLLRARLQDPRVLGSAATPRVAVNVSYRQFLSESLPEIIDAAVEHYMENPDARRELRDPEAIARTVEVLRSHATTAWWRSQRRPVPVPRLVPGSTGRDEFLRKWSL